MEAMCTGPQRSGSAYRTRHPQGSARYLRWTPISESRVLGFALNLDFYLTSHLQHCSECEKQQGALYPRNITYVPRITDIHSHNPMTKHSPSFQYQVLHVAATPSQGLRKPVFTCRGSHG